MSAGRLWASRYLLRCLLDGMREYTGGCDVSCWSIWLLFLSFISLCSRGRGRALVDTHSEDVACSAPLGCRRSGTCWLSLSVSFPMFGSLHAGGVI